ncbi:MAG: hypothetical protein A3E61_00220 [Candidatus Colwellbacteria bacterium RIFCSPHIGHO2_12_FULL_43_12]|uniref:Major facilitator superfamily associated domain-containing protein n=3 Tax=Candidatus Colwelliibacteriota TaxID=1817904 RepID=A0A1G1Z450_9BACT|nr:MAG: hypothetical protein A3E61_00220 [Candidatus Colwellbacteria bacterium RIFCSPHIGHO2_12_FULL_43_12]
MNDLKKILGFILPGTRLNRSLRILIVTNSIMVFILGLFAPFYAIFVERIGGSIAFAGFSWGVLLIVAGTLIFLFSNWELKVKEPELLIAFGHIVRGVVFLSYAFMGSMTQLIVTQVLWGIAIALSAPAFDSIYSAHTDKDGAISEWGGWEGIAAISAGSAALIGGLIIEGFGYQPVFLSMTAISVGLGIYIWRLPREVL